MNSLPHFVPTVKLSILESAWLRTVERNNGLAYAHVPQDYAAVTRIFTTLQGQGLITTVERDDSTFHRWYEITPAGRAALENEGK